MHAGRFQLDPCDTAGNTAMLTAPGPDGVPLVIPGNLESPLYLRMLGDQPEFPQMPPGGLSKDKLLLVKEWILN